jgi:hypothetical protein
MQRPGLIETRRDRVNPQPHRGRAEVFALLPMSTLPSASPPGLSYWLSAIRVSELLPVIDDQRFPLAHLFHRVLHPFTTETA